MKRNVAAASITAAVVDWKSLGVLAAWGAAGALVVIRRFRWDPRPE